MMQSQPFEQIDNMPLTEGPKCNMVKIDQAVSEKKTFKDYNILYIYITQEDKILIVTKRVCYFDHTLQVSVSGLSYIFRKRFYIFSIQEYGDANLTLP